MVQLGGSGGCLTCFQRVIFNVTSLPHVGNVEWMTRWSLVGAFFTLFFNVFCVESKGSKVCMTRRKNSQGRSNASKTTVSTFKSRLKTTQRGSNVPITPRCQRPEKPLTLYMPTGTTLAKPPPPGWPTPTRAKVHL